MLTKAIEVMRYVKASAGRSSLNVVFEKDNHPRHDGKTIYLPRITKDTSDGALLDMMASTDHEVAHDLYSDFGILQEKHIDPMKSPLGLIWNVVEDSRVNALEAKEYEGFRELWEQTCPEVLVNVLKNNSGSEGLAQLIRGLVKWETKVSAPIFPVCSVVGEKYPSDEKLDTILNKFSDQLKACQAIEKKVQGSKATYELARDIFKALGGDPDEEERKAKAEAEGKGTPTKGKPGNGKDKAKDGEGEAIEGEGDDKVSSEDWCIKKVKIEDLDKRLPSVHTEITSIMSKVGLMHESTPRGSPWTMTPLENFIVVDYVNNSCTHSSYSGVLETDGSTASFFTENFNSRVRGKAITSENFAQQVRRLIQIRARVKYEYGVKRGKLDQSRLARLVLKAPGISERVFKNKITNTTLDAAVSILLDMSGSMSGDKVFFACEAAMLLHEVFQVLQVPLEIVGFTDNGDLPIQFVYKPFSKIRLSPENLLSYIGASSGCMSGNPDGDCILWTYDRLLKRTEKKRLLIVMSDGQPAASRCESGCSSFTYKAIDEIEKQGKVDIYGLGLCTTSVKEYYTHHSSAFTPEEIPQRLLELIERKLLDV